jgi:hypothetical protein
MEVVLNNTLDANQYFILNDTPSRECPENLNPQSIKFSHFRLSRFIAQYGKNMHQMNDDELIEMIKPFNIVFKSEICELPIEHVKNMLQIANKYEEAYKKIIPDEVLKKKGFRALACVNDLVNLLYFDFYQRGVVQKPSEIKLKMDSYENRLNRLSSQVSKMEKKLEDNLDSVCFCYITIAENEELNQNIRSLNNKIGRLLKERISYEKVSSITNPLIPYERSLNKSPMREFSPY